MDDKAGLRALATNDVMSVRMEGLILTALVERNVLTAAEARALVQDVINNAPKDATLAPAYEGILRELHD